MSKKEDRKKVIERINIAIPLFFVVAGIISLYIVIDVRNFSRTITITHLIAGLVAATFFEGAFLLSERKVKLENYEELLVEKTKEMTMEKLKKKGHDTEALSNKVDRLVRENLKKKGHIS